MLGRCRKTTKIHKITANIMTAKGCGNKRARNGRTTDATIEASDT